MISVPDRKAAVDDERVSVDVVRGRAGEEQCGPAEVDTVAAHVSERNPGGEILDKAGRRARVPRQLLAVDPAVRARTLSGEAALKAEQRHNVAGETVMSAPNRPISSAERNVLCTFSTRACIQLAKAACNGGHRDPARK